MDYKEIKASFSCLCYPSMLWLKQLSRRRNQDYRRRWGWTVVGHWWTPGRCCSLLTQSLKGQEASGLLPASGEEAAGCKPWKGWGCRQSLLPLILAKVGGRRGGVKEQELMERLVRNR